MQSHTAMLTRDVKVEVPQSSDFINTQIGDGMGEAVMSMEEQTTAGADARQLSLGDVFLSPGILDQLDAQCVSNELLEMQMLQEKQAFAPGSASLGRAERPVLQPHIRFITLRFLSHIAQQIGLPEMSWIEAPALLDMYHLKTRETGCNVHAITTLPATCAAVVCILKKNDDATALVGGSSFVRHASWFAQHLQQSGYPTVNTEMTAKMINDQERHVLEALDWRIQVSTTESWASTFITRFNVLTRSLLKQSMQRVRQQSIFGARHFMMQQAVNPEQPPRVLATGLLGIGLVGVCLLPLEAIQPDDMSCAEWKQLYAEIQPQQPQPHCAIPDGLWQNLLNLLIVAVGADLSMIKHASRLAATSLRALLGAMAPTFPPHSAHAQEPAHTLPSIL